VPPDRRAGTAQPGAVPPRPRGRAYGSKCPG
jgi:hypothetical protein